MRSRRLFLRLGVALLVGVVGYFGFRMFDYVLTWKVGWRAFEESPRAASSSSVDPQWVTLEETAMELLREARRDLSAPAVSAAVSLRGVRVFAGAVGLADMASNEPVSLTSSFRLGSSSKAVTSVTLGTLLEAGRVDLEAPVGNYLDDLGAQLASVTVRQAMSHTAGIRNYGLCWCFPIWEQFSRREFGTSVRRSLSVFKRDALLFEPGTAFRYSSYGTNTVGAVIEAIVDGEYLAYVEQAVFEQLGMKHSGADLVSRDVPGRVAFFEVEQRRWRPAYPVNNSIKWPSGGLVSTPSDMVALGNAMLSSRLLSSETRNVLITPQQLADGSENPEGYALGWRYSEQKELFNGAERVRFVSHHGVAVGSTSYFGFYPDEMLVVSVMINRSQQGVSNLAEHATALVELFLKRARETRE